jgi:RNA-directed DNA polymerase
MSSRKDNNDRKSRKGNCLDEVVVNTQDNQGVSKSEPIQIKDYSCKDECSLMDQILNRENLLEAIKRVEKNKGAAGVDKMEVTEFRSYLKDNWLRDKELLMIGKYKPSPVRRVVIPKPDGGERYLGIPTVLDRFIQQAILQVLTPIYDPRFSDNSYGFRPRRSAHQAILKSQEYIQEGYNIVVDIDLEKFFDKVNHDKLMSIIARDINDKILLKLIRAYLNAGIMENGCCVESETGVPQGGPLSPLLANIMLDGLDIELERRGHKFVRYADDCNIYVKSKRAGERVMSSVKELVETKLKLKVNEKKSAVDKPSRRKFLGMTFTPD